MNHQRRVSVGAAGVVVSFIYCVTIFARVGNVGVTQLGQLNIVAGTEIFYLSISFLPLRSPSFLSMRDGLTSSLDTGGIETEIGHRTYLLRREVWPEEVTKHSH
ncbi:hypothetical protein BGW80DRAFT_1446423 [Lactifluus volemus]|nr:hypothetical protein BGW80DRAFT_1446423 [Lactifluus volemus]